VTAALGAPSGCPFAGRQPVATAQRPFVPQAGRPSLRLLRRVGVVDPTSLAPTALRRLRRPGARARARPRGVVAEVTASKLVGRGGAAFPTGRKWEAVREAKATPHYLVCNADESEPGTFKDRVLMEEDPFALVEAMTIAAFATGCERGFVYLRGEYPKAHERLANAITQARAAGLLGADVAGAGFAFDLEIRRGAGAYICGEETALFESIEGYRGEPRSKPPFPVESVCSAGRRWSTTSRRWSTCCRSCSKAAPPTRASARRLGGAEAVLRLRPGRAAGALRGPVRRHARRAARARRRRRRRPRAEGGAARRRGGRLRRPRRARDAAHLRGHARGGRHARLRRRDGLRRDGRLADALVRIAEFFRHESCGQCVPCRVGTVRQHELLARLRSGRELGSRAQELALLGELAQAMRDASICGLGQTASSAIESALARFDPFGDDAATP
jgi:NADH-quinone oxidoreductase subunit F